MSIVYKQWYKPRNLPTTPLLNAKHLSYIACRKGVIPNKGCGFGLWGKTDAGIQVQSIHNFREAMGHVRKASREHTLYRAVVSLDEKTSVEKGYLGREQWEELLGGHIAVIAKENSINAQDFRWYAAYHHERGHPHVHILFWDAGDKVREECMSPERFEIASEKIRASFNKEVYRKELERFRAEQSISKHELHSFSRNFLDADTTYLDRDSGVLEPRFYPKTLKQAETALIHTRLEKALYLLPDTGQLKYQYLPSNTKAALNSLSEAVLGATTMASPYAGYLEAARRISLTYGNSEEAAERQVKRQRQALLKEVGNDLLKAIKSLRYLERRTEARREELGRSEHDNCITTAGTILTDKLALEDFRSRLAAAAALFPKFLTPKHEILKDEEISGSLRSLTLECLNDDRLSESIKIASAFQETTGQETGEKLVNAFQAAYQFVNQALFEEACRQRGYEVQSHHADVAGLLFAFCGLSQIGQRLHGKSAAFYLKRELSKQAKKEHAQKYKDSTHLWEDMSTF